MPQMVSAKTRAPLVAPINVCFRNSNLGFSLLKKFSNYDYCPNSNEARRQA
jgi:hypothetical protein